MTGMGGGHAGITRVGAIVLQQAESRLCIKPVQLGEIIESPSAFQARGVTKDRRLPFREADIVFRADASAGQQGITTNL